MLEQISATRGIQKSVEYLEHSCDGYSSVQGTASIMYADPMSTLLPKDEGLEIREMESSAKHRQARQD